MSRKFIDDHAILFDTRDRIPGATDTAWDAGHIFQDSTDGSRFINEGDKNGAIFGHYPANRYELVERFLQRPAINANIDQAYTVEVARAANRDWETLGTNATTALVTFADGGGINLATAGADEDQTIITPHLDTAQTAWTGTQWNTSDKVIFETNIKITGSVAAVIIWAGLKLTNDNVVATDAEQAFLRLENGVNDGNWQLITSDNGTDTTTNTDVVGVSTTGMYHIKLVVNGDRDVTAFINGVLVARVEAALGTDHDLIPFIGVEASTAAARAINVRGVRMSKDLND